MNKSILLLLLLFSLILTSCNESDTVRTSEASNNQEINDSTEIKKLEKLLNQREYKELLSELNNFEDTDNKKVKKLSADFLSELIKMDNYSFLYENRDTIENSMAFGDKSKKDLKNFLEDKKEELLDKMENYISQKNYNDLEILYKSNNIIEEDAEGSTLYHYVIYLQNEENSENPSYELATFVNPNYNGRLKNDIVKAITDDSYYAKSGVLPIDKMEWESIYEQHQREIEQELENSNRVDPAIGMTNEEVLESTWGKPQEINKTTSSYGVSEQWVYPDYKYLYFEDGILTTIQE
ncbi:hypothetical protein [Rummeliibacillus suwonensis]|uniref:hypothetical protein n=1 Tax=Rummeliibacillus suwonensis TaxID=1306154 RepID=UPI0011B3D4B8|nr:hypothetical protein [Rummeliibacillus suwonensis]